MATPQELITTLKNQHRSLQFDLSLALENSRIETEKEDKNILFDLEKFKKDLSEHLKLENEVFYPDYLAKKLKNGEDITKTEEFISQMIVIGDKVTEFLNKYSTPEAINSNISNFKEELVEIMGILNIRIETEEEGVFEFYLLS